MKVSALALTERKVAVRVGPQPEDVVEVTYRPGALTLQVADDLREAQFNPLGDVEVVGHTLLTIIEKWDLMDDDGTPYPVSEESIKKLPIEFLGRIFNAIQNDAIPDPTKGANSSDGSQQEERSEDSPNGTPS